MNAPASSIRYEPELDGLRTIAIFAVIAFHSMLGTVPGGWVGVDLFFVLSGYLITTIVERKLRTGSFDLGPFYLNRALRLYPALLIFVIVMVVVTLTDERGPLLRIQALMALSYVMNWYRIIHATGANYFGHTWSLAIEMQFYLLWPLFLIFVPQHLKLRIASLLILSVVIWRLYLVGSGASEERVYNGLDTHCDSLIAGAILAWIGARGAWPRVSLAGSAVVVAVLLAILRFTGTEAPALQWWGLTVSTAISAAVLVVIRGNDAIAAVLAWRPLVLIGKVSYGVYLWHFPMIEWLHRLDMPFKTRLDFVAFGGAVALSSTITATLSYLLVEKPVLRWRNAHGLREVRSRLA